MSAKNRDNKNRWRNITVGLSLIHISKKPLDTNKYA